MNISRLRSQTPGTNNVIHFNNAGASLMPRPVSEAMISYLEEETAYGGYETAQKYEEKIKEVYSHIAGLINAKPGEIALMENATAAWNMAFHALDFESGDRILTSASEYASNYIAYIKLQEQVDISVEVIPSEVSGQTSTEALARMMDEDVKLVSITHIPTNSGLVNPVKEIGKIIQKHSCLYLVDACQSVGQYPVDVQRTGCDMLSATGRKYLRGPRGTGFLYVNNNALSGLTPPFLDLHGAEWTGKQEYKMRDDARRFENWEFNYAAVIGLGEAVAYANEQGINNIWKRIRMLAERLRHQLSRLSAITVRDIGDVKGGIVTFTLEGIKAEEVRSHLAEHNINVSVSGRSSTLIDMERRNLEEVVRASLHYYNTEEEIETLIKVLRSLSF